MPRAMPKARDQALLAALSTVLPRARRRVFLVRRFQPSNGRGFWLLTHGDFSVHADYQLHVAEMKLVVEET